MEARPVELDAAFNLFYWSDRTSRDARARQSQGRGIVRSQEIQRQRSFLRKSSRQIRSRAARPLNAPAKPVGVFDAPARSVIPNREDGEGPLNCNLRLLVKRKPVL